MRTHLVSSFQWNNELLALAAAKYARTDTKRFQYSLIFLDFLIFLKLFYTGCKSMQKTIKDKSDIYKKQRMIC